MIDGLAPGSFAAFLVTSAVIELTPGPNMAWLAIVAAGEGRRPGYAAVAGVALGLGIVGIAAALGLATMVAASPLAYQALRWGGVLYLLWLAWDGWRDAGDGIAHLPDRAPLGRYFRRGLITNLLNPKAAVFYIAVLPGFADPAGVVLVETLTLSMAYVAVATAIHAAIVTAAGLARRVLDDPARSRMVRRALSLTLAGIALWFAWSSAVPAT
ncbi:LysE family translocator [Defluviimonas sp. WL0024]|uniref:LysE family translocator n=2 Tax=Albidovulum TaxID=205889 RepID=A0ABT3J6T2_9RHOB|nr:MULTISPECIES: LysE family translocator [Defluviimonas]MCU9850222.1 LysE family translocator [Defluviimonas sp. WL0024]MCW3783394.1 LysE family translocator [Defluviimonas salinarum]